MPNRKLYRPSWAARLSLLIHGCWAVVFAFVLWVGPSGRSIEMWGASVWVPECRTCDAGRDAISTAAEMGRLDVVSLSLAMLGVALAFAALGSYFIVRNAAMQAAREEAEEQTRQLLPKMVGTDLVAEAFQKDPTLLYQVAGIIAKQVSPDVSSSEADQISRALDEDGNNEPK